MGRKPTAKSTGAIDPAAVPEAINSNEVTRASAELSFENQSLLGALFGQFDANLVQVENRLGVSKYYQLMLFPNLDGAKIVVKNNDGTKMDYRRFPITICCTELPAGMSPSDVEKKQFVVDGYFFRFWKYRSDKTDEAASTGQVSPLIIAKCPQMIEPDTRSLNLTLFIFIVTVIAGLSALIGGYKIADRRRQSPVEKILGTLPERIDLSGLED